MLKGALVELNKKKYKKAEVEQLIKDLSDDYQLKINEQKERLKELDVENKNLISEISELKANEKLICKTLESAEKQAEDLSDKSMLKYRLEIERLKRFVEKFNAYFNYLQEKYPYYPATKEAEATFKKISAIVNGAVNKKAIEKVDAVIPEIAEAKVNFNPKDKIKDYIYATGDNGFNMEEVLNPGQLELEDLCKELGLMDDEN